MSKELSSKIKLISLLCTIMVVYRHAYTAETFYGGFCAEWDLYNFLAHGITNLTSIAVPYFFLISGFFFFKQSYYKDDNYYLMLRKKFKTLFIPFVFWNLLAFIPMWYAGKIVEVEHWYLYIVDLLHSDYNGPLWYVRTLMLLMLLSPLYDWIFLLDGKVGVKSELYIQALIIGYIFYIWWPMDSKTLSTEGWLFFLLGGVLRKNELCLTRTIKKNYAVALYLCWVGICFLHISNCWLGKLHLLLGIVLFWNVIRTGCKGWVSLIAGYAFFVYVNHFVLLKAIKVFFAHYFYGSQLVALLIFILSPIFSTLFLWKLGEIWNHYCPKSFAWVMGGRVKMNINKSLIIKE